MSAVDLQLSLRRLRDTADALEVPAQLERPPAPLPEPALVAAPAPQWGRRSIRRLLVSTVVHTAVTVTVLAGVSALADPLLPHPDRPQLGGSPVASADDVAPPAPIPPLAQTGP